MNAGLAFALFAIIAAANVVGQAISVLIWRPPLRRERIRQMRPLPMEDDQEDEGRGRWAEGDFFNTFTPRGQPRISRR